MGKDNRAKIALSEKQKKIISAYGFSQTPRLSKQEVHNLAIQGLFDDIPKMTEKELLNLYDRMTPDQRKYPHK